MAVTPSTMELALGAQAPQFQLPDTDGKITSLSDFKDASALLVMFICNHCPYVKHLRAEFVRLAHDYQPRGVAIVAINSNDSDTYPADSPEKMKEEKESAGYTFPYLFDRTQEVAKAYRAACTPDFFLFDRSQKLVYRGQFDDSRPKNNLAATGNDMRAALDDLLAGQAISAQQTPSMGCNIKWRPGNEPTYFAH